MRSRFWRVVAGSAVSIGLVICIIGWNYGPAFKAGVVITLCGLALRLVNLGGPLDEEHGKSGPGDGGLGALQGEAGPSVPGDVKD